MTAPKRKPARQRPKTTKRPGILATFGLAKAVLYGFAGVVITVGTSLGFHLVTPGSRVEQVDAERRRDRHEIDSILAFNRRVRDSLLAENRARQALLETHLTSIDGKLDIWLRGECLDRTPKDKLLMGIIALCPKLQAIP